MWRNAIHGKDEALRLIYSFTETLPIAPPTEEARAEAEPAVARLIEIARRTQQTWVDVLYWLRTEFGVETPGQRLEEVATLDAEGLVEEIRKRRPRSAGRLTPAGLADLRRGYAEQAEPVRALRAEAAVLDRRLSALVNAARGPTPEDEALLRETAPPRMPRY